MLKTNITSNIFTKEETEEGILKTLAFLRETLSKTLGPYGSTTIIQDRQMQHTISKDGYTVLGRIQVAENLPKTIIHIVRNISKTLVRTVGDGSTSSIVIAEALYRNLSTLGKKYSMSPKDMVNALDICAEIFEAEIKRISKPINDDNIEVIKDIASVSNNNDENIGEIIYNIYKSLGAYAHIHVKSSTKKKDYYEVTSGQEVRRSYIDPIFATEPNKIEVKIPEPYVFMCNGQLVESDMSMLADLIGKICLSEGRGLVIVAKSYDPFIRNFLHQNKKTLTDKINLVAIDIAYGSSKRANDKFEDLALATGCKYYDKNSNESYNEENKEFDLSRLGSCEKFECNDTRSVFINCNSNEEDVKKVVAELKDEVVRLDTIQDNIDRDQDVIDLKMRIASLENTLVTFYVGGNTEQERDSRKYLIEDSVYASKSAIENGYTAGGNLTIPRILDNKDVRERILNQLASSKELRHLNKKDSINFSNDILDNISTSFKESFREVLSNSVMTNEDIEKHIDYSIENDCIFNLKTRKFENTDNTKVINSASTEIEIMKACFSIIGLLSTSNQFISVDVYDRKHNY